MMIIGKSRRAPRAGLTLAELMVAAGILAVITVFSAQVMGDVSRVWLGGKGRSEVFNTARALMTRLRLDLERSVPTSDLPGFARNPSAPRLEFTSRVQGVMESGSSGARTVGRPLSFIRYDLGAPTSDDRGYVLREDRAFSWEEPPFGADEGSARARRLCPNVLGFQHRFVGASGDLKTEFVGGSTTNRTVAVHVALAVCDERTFQTLKLSDQLSQVMQAFSSIDPLKWEERVSGAESTLPQMARQGIRVFHQVVPLPSIQEED